MTSGGPARGRGQRSSTGRVSLYVYCSQSGYYWLPALSQVADPEASSARAVPLPRRRSANALTSNGMDMTCRFSGERVLLNGTGGSVGPDAPIGLVCMS